MRRRAASLVVLACLLGPANRAEARAPSPPTVKDTALDFGKALMHNDGRAALALLSPDFRRNTPATQLPRLLGVDRAPLGAHVVRWQYRGRLGDATLSLAYTGVPVAEHLYLRLYPQGWLITGILSESPAMLRRGAEAAVTAFFDAALHRDAMQLRAQLTSSLGRSLSAARVPALLGLAGPLTVYRLAGYDGTPAGADVYVLAACATGSIRVHLVVINERDGWRIAAIERAAA